MIRALEPADVERLAAGIAQLPLMQKYSRSEAALAADFRAGYERGDHLFVWDAGKGPEGILWFFPTGMFAMGGYLRLIAMTPGSTSKGAGAKLLEEYERHVRAAGRHAFLLVSDFNADAQRFYEKHGYVRVGALPKLVRPDVDELIYWKRLR